MIYAVYMYSIGVFFYYNRVNLISMTYIQAKSGTLTGYGEKESKTLKSQMKKGLSVIVNKTAAITNTNNGKSSAAGKTNSSTLRVVLRKDEINNSGTILLAPSSGKSSAENEDPTKAKSNASKKCKR